jgi:hypothetical protein
MALGGASAARTACALVRVRGGTDEKTDESLSAAAVAERVDWCAALVKGMAARLVSTHWDVGGLRALASGADPAGRPLPAQAWMALRRLAWAAAAPDRVRVNDRVARMAQELAGRLLRSALWRDALTTAVTVTWPADPAKRTPQEWDAVRAAVPGGEYLPSAVIRARTRQVARCLQDQGRLPAGVTALEGPPRVPAMLVLAACDKQQAGIERHETDPARALLRVQLPARPDPRSYRDWSWVALPLALPPTVPAGAALHLPTLRVAGGRVLADVAFTHLVPQAKRTGHRVALGIDWGLNTLLSAGAVRCGSARTGRSPRSGRARSTGQAASWRRRTGCAATASGSTPSSITASASPPDGKSTRSPGRPPSWRPRPAASRAGDRT